VSVIIWLAVSAGVVVILVESDVTVVDVESVLTSVVLVSPPQAARNAETQRTISTFFILIDLDFYNLFSVYTLILKK
jgi:hypothetical protein